MTDAVDLPGDGIQGGSPPRPEGNGASRRNAMKQSSAADTLLPEILRADLIDTYYRRLCEELQPATPTAEFLVREMARHEAALARIEQMEEAVLRRGLVTWFTAIEMLLNRPDTSTAELAEATGIHRVGTLRGVAKKIRAAAKSPDATVLLAGLDRLFG